MNESINPEVMKKILNHLSTTSEQKEKMVKMYQELKDSDRIVEYNGSFLGMLAEFRKK